MIDEDATLIFEEATRLSKAMDKVVKDFLDGSNLIEGRRLILLQSTMYSKLNYIQGLAAAITLNSSPLPVDLDDMETVGGKQ